MSRPAGLAAIGVGLEAVGLAVLVGWEFLALVRGDADSVTSSIALCVLTAGAALAVAACAVGIGRDRSWARSGGIVVQALVVAVSIGAVTGDYVHVGIAVALAIPAVAIAILIFRAAARSGDARRTRPDSTTDG